jgi:hypothetical protein
MQLDQTSMHGLFIQAEAHQISPQLTVSPTVVTLQKLLLPRQFQKLMTLTIQQLPALQLPILMVFVPQLVVLQHSQLTHGAIQMLKLLIPNTADMPIQLEKTFAILTLKLQAQSAVVISSQTALFGSISI